MNSVLQQQKKHLTGRLLTLLMLLFAFTGVMRASAEQGNVRADQVIEQGFEDGLGDWTLNHCHSSSGPSSQYGGNTGNYAFRFYYTANYPQYLISPELDDNDGVNFTFYAARYSSNYPETFIVGYSSTTNDPTEFTWGSEVTCTTMYGAGAYQEYSYDFPAGTKYVSIACTSNDQFYLFVDDITVTATEPAPTPGGIVEVTIGDPTSTTTSSYLPSYSLYEYAISQQIYTADEIGVAGTIETLTMWLKNSSSYARNINVYMTEVEATEFASNTDWVSMSDSDLVGSFTLANGVSDPTETAIELTTPFEYTGAGNLVICFQDVTGSWSSGAAGVVMDANGYQAIYAYRDGTSYDVSNPGVNGTLLAKKNVVRLAIMTGGGAGPAIVANPETIDLGFRPNGYWMEPVIFELYNQGSEGIVTAVESADPFFTVDVEVPYTLARHESLFGTITTGTADNVGEINTQLTVLYEGEGLEDQDTTYVDVTVTAYQAVTPDVWELAEEVTEFPFQTTTTTADLYKNYNLLGMNDMAKDAVYKVTFDNDVLFSASVSGEDAVAYIYEEGFNDYGGPMADNNYEYDGPTVNPGPTSLWFNYAYTGSNTWYGTSAGGGFYFGYKISTDVIAAENLAGLTITTVEAAAREAYPYHCFIIEGGADPFEGNMIGMGTIENPTALYFFDINLSIPAYITGNADIWVIFYSDSPYAAYCGRYPVDTANGKIWTYNPNATTPQWTSNTTYTPVIYCRMLELPTGRTATMDLAKMEVKKGNGVVSEVAEAEGNVMNVAKAQIANNNSRDVVGNNIEDMFVPAGTYYVVVASSSEDFQVDMDVADVPAPEQAVVVAPYDGESSVGDLYLAQWVLGYYTNEMQVLYGTDYPPTTPLIDWTDYLVESAFLPELAHNRMYFFQVNERNETGTTEGEIISFTTPFDAVQGFAAVTPYIFIDETAEFTWDAIEDEELIGYNFYDQNGVQLNEEVLTETYFAVDSLEYSVGAGYYFYVEAVYESGVSSWVSEHIWVSGYGVVQGTVYEQDGEIPIANVTVSFAGTDDFGFEQSFTANTNEEGNYSVTMKTGFYPTVFASLEGYQDKYYDEEVVLWYNDTVTGIDFVIDEVFAPVSEVTATFNPDENDPNSPYVKVDWVDNANGDRSLNRYRVYRTAFDNDGPYNEHNTKLVAEVTGETFTIDESWENIESGLYKYGVGSVYEGNREVGYELSESFDDGFPEGWAMLDADGDGRCWMLGSQASLGYGHGHNGSNDMMISKSFENGSDVCPDNYLITPEVKFSQFSEFSFWACAQDANYAGEYFEVMVSTPSTGYDFVSVYGWSLDNRDMDRKGARNSRAQGTWYQFVADLGQFAGETGNVAIRHCYSCGNFYLDIDDVVLHNTNIQEERESEIVWSNFIGKDMYLTDGAVSIQVMLNSGDAPEGISATFHNTNEPDLEDIVVELDDNGYYAFDSFRKGEYEITLTKADYYNEVGTYYIVEPISLEFMMYEHLYAPRNLKVSHTGYATWDAPQSPDRHLVDDLYNIYLYDAYENLLWYTTVYDNHEYMPEDLLTDGVMYITKVCAYYSANGGGLYPSELATCTWKYKSCDHYEGVSNLKAKPMDEGVYMTWDYPVVDTTARANRDMWDLKYTFRGTSAGQQAIATDGEYIYTASWQSSPTGGYTFYQYDMNGNFIEGFDIEGAMGIRDLTSDGQYFYASSGGETIMVLDFANRVLVGTIYCQGLTSRHISYDPERDGFWAGNWTTLALYDRDGYKIMDGPSLVSAYGSAYYKDTEGIEHLYLFCQPNSDAKVYDFNITAGTLSEEPVCDFAQIEDFNGIAGGAFVGEYDGQMCFFGNVQQDPNLIGIFELGASTEQLQPIGANIYLYDELVGFTTDNNYMFEGYSQYETFGLRLVYENYEMGCMQYPDMINRYWIYTYAYPSNAGTVTESALYYEGDTCTLTAEAFEDFDFVRWEDAWYGGVVSTNPTYSFVVTRETEFMARYVTDSYYNDVNLYENNMNVIGLIKIEGEEQTNPFLEIGAFCNYECRGHQRLKYYPQVDRYLVYLTIYGNEGDQINFRLYNNEWGNEMGMICLSTITFEADAVIGTPFEPYEFNFYETYWNEQYDELNTGWNWWSTYIEQGGNYNGLADLQAYLTNSGYMISSQTEFTMNYGTYGWYGSLNSITNESMYKIKMNQAGYSDLYYYNARPDLHPITVVPGWNYIGYVSDYEMDLNDALMGLEPSDGDMIKSQYAYANYYEGYGWFGSLNYMEPGKGYMYKAADTATFIYGQETRGITKENLTAENNHWVPNANAYKDNMTIMAVVNMNEVELVSDNYELAAFVDGECRGSVRLTYSEPINRYVAFLTVAGEDVTTLRFGLYDETTGTECYSNDLMEFNSDVVAGNPSEPVVISFSGMNDNSGFMVYPNPVAKGECVNIVLPNGLNRARVEVLNALGEIVSVETIAKSQVSIALPAVSGVYTIRIITDNKDIDFKKVIVK
ncbi:MAG: choice-of-anchor J domain-containing protein [Bacteroidales bacterium]|nr:choice-of-anchor J domain-containing protein [Bacteroidales bacterium]